jgi:hypothetical protein
VFLSVHALFITGSDAVHYHPSMEYSEQVRIGHFVISICVTRAICGFIALLSVHALFVLGSDRTHYQQYMRVL